MKKTQGFTLIELLVVIAIIGILSSIVIASLNSARTKGAVSAAKGQMSQMRAQAEIYYESNGNSYGTSTTCATGMFSAPTGLAAQITQIGNNVTSASCSTGDNGQKWSYRATLKDATVWCIDNSGFNGTATSNLLGVCA